MRIVFRDNLNNVEIEDWGEWHRTVVAIETLKPSTETPYTQVVFDELYLKRKSIDLPFELKMSIDQSAFQENLKRIFIIIKHQSFRLRISVINKIWKRKMLVGGILKILARHGSEYNKHLETDASLFDIEFVVPDIIDKLISCRINGTLTIEDGNSCYTFNNFKLVTLQISNSETEDVISFYPIN